MDVRQLRPIGKTSLAVTQLGLGGTALGNIYSAVDEQAAAWSATSVIQCSTVFGSTAKTRATARIPSPSAIAPTAHTNTSGGTRLPCNGVSWVSRKYVLHPKH
jgi:hypothetical protein